MNKGLAASVFFAGKPKPRTADQRVVVLTGETTGGGQEVAKSPDQPPASARCTSVATNANAQANSKFPYATLPLSVVVKVISSWRSRV